MVDTLCVILGGGRGTRLFPLTKERSKPAVPLAGEYRLIDIPISNCLNSGLNMIYVLTQFKSESLNKHVIRTFKLDMFSKGFVEIMVPEQSMESMDWFQGTADAVRQCLKHFENPVIKRILVLSGDQFYKFNFMDLINLHMSKKAQITVACNPVPANEVSEYGILGIDREGRITGFVEKPGNAEEIRDSSVNIDNRDVFLASMGIYLFEKGVLVELLTKSKKADFGKEIMPEAFKKYYTCAFTYKGYWKDIGTIKSLYEANLMLTDPLPKLDMFDEQWPFFTRPRNLPPSKVDSSHIERSMIADGCIIDKSTISHSIIGIRSRIGHNTRIEDSIILGSDFYESLDALAQNEKNRTPSIGVGKNCHIKKAIIDKNARVGDNVKIINKNNLKTFDSDNVYIRDGIVIITKNARIPDGTVI